MNIPSKQYRKTEARPTPIGANASIRWMDETLHPEAEIERHRVYFAFGESDLDDDSIFHFFIDESALHDYIEYPYAGFAISDYELVF